MKHLGTFRTVLYDDGLNYIYKNRTTERIGWEWHVIWKWPGSWTIQENAEIARRYNSACFKSNIIGLKPWKIWLVNRFLWWWQLLQHCQALHRKQMGPHSSLLRFPKWSPGIFRHFQETVKQTNDLKKILCKDVVKCNISSWI